MSKAVRRVSVAAFVVAVLFTTFVIVVCSSRPLFYNRYRWPWPDPRMGWVSDTKVFADGSFMINADFSNNMAIVIETGERPYSGKITPLSTATQAVFYIGRDEARKIVVGRQRDTAVVVRADDDVLRVPLDPDQARSIYREVGHANIGDIQEMERCWSVEQWELISEFLAKNKKVITTHSDSTKPEQ